MIKRNPGLINLYTICNNLVFILPVIVPYYKTIGLDFQDFMRSEAVFSGVLLLAQVPAGWISDVWRRRSVLVLAMVFAIAGYSLLIFAHNLMGAMTAQGIIGIAVALSSGTLSAMLYDSLLQEGRQEDFRRLEGRRHAFGLYAVAVSCVIGAWTYTIHPRLPLILDIAVLAVAMVAIGFAIEPQRHKKSSVSNPWRDMRETVHYALRGHPEVAGIIMVSMVVFCTTKMMLWEQQPYYALLGMPVQWFGMVMAGTYILGGIAGHWSHKIDHWGSNRVKLGFMAGLLSSSCIVLWLFPSVTVGLILFLAGTMTYGMGFPVMQNAINTQVGSERRATILSTANLAIYVLFIPTSLIIGAIGKSYSIPASIGVLGIEVAIMAAMGLWLWKPVRGPVPA